MPAKGYKKPLEETAEYRRKHGKKPLKNKTNNGVKNSPKNRNPQNPQNAPENGGNNEPKTAPEMEQKIELRRPPELPVSERPVRRCDILKEAYSFRPTKADMPDTVDVQKLNSRDRATLMGFFSAAVPGETFTPEEMRLAMADYMAHVMDTNEHAPLTERWIGKACEMVKKIAWIPTVDGFCLYAGIPPTTYKKQMVKPEYLEMCDAFRAWCKTFTIEETLKDKLPSIPGIFVMKAEHKMVEAAPEKPAESPLERIGQATVDALFTSIRQRQIQQRMPEPPVIDAVDVRVVETEKTTDS